MTNPYRNINELREWLKANSSGVYRPAAHAETVIGEQESELITLRADNSGLRSKLSAMESQAKQLITKACCNAVEKLTELAPNQGWDSGEVVAEMYIRQLSDKPVPADKPARITEQDAIPDGYREEWKRHVMLMWSCVRRHDSRIPSDVLDYMRDQLLNKLNAEREQVPTFDLCPSHESEQPDPDSDGE